MHNQRPPPPDFVIAGAAKCGTTALYEYFREHPQVFMTIPKEPHYFADDLHSPHYITEESKYLQLFAAAPKNTVRGEASVLYINSNHAIDRLMQHNPDTKIFVLLRNPVDLASSWHAQLVYNGEEDIKDFKAAWQAQAARAAGRRLPAHLTTSAKKLQYRDMCAIGRQAARVAARVPKEQLLILLLDDLIREPEVFFRKATGFLGVHYQPLASNTIVNPSRRNRSDRLARFINWSKPINNPYIRGLAPLFDRLGFHPLRLLRLANTLPNTYTETSGKFRQQLYEAFCEDIDILEELLDRPLSNWRTP